MCTILYVEMVLEENACTRRDVVRVAMSFGWLYDALDPSESCDDPFFGAAADPCSPHLNAANG